MISARPSTPESGRPAAIDFATVDQVGLDAEVLDGERLAGAAEAGLDLVGDEHDAVLVAGPPQALHELQRRHDEARLALHRLDDDRSDVLGGDARLEGVFERLEVAEREAVGFRRERAEARLVGVSLRREAEREQRAAVEGSLEGDHRRALRGGARELDRVLDRLGARVEECCTLLARDRRQLEQPLGKADVVLVRDDREIGVREAFRLLADRLHHAGMRMADVHAADASGEVDERVPVDVGQGGAPPLGDHEREIDGERLRDDPRLPGEDLGAAGSRNVRLQLDCPCRGHVRSL